MRLRIEHSGFSTLNNQRFGSKFVGDVANPTDMLLFSKKQTLEQAEAKKIKDKGASSSTNCLLSRLTRTRTRQSTSRTSSTTFCTCPSESLSSSPRSLMAIALDNIVSNNETGAIEATVESTLAKNQKDLMARGRKGKSMDKNSIRELTIQKSNEQREKDKLNDDAVKRKVRNSELRASVPLMTLY